MYQALLQKKILIFGCGNPLMGDDGFGPAVIEHITKTHPQTDDVGFLDAGTSVRDLLFDLLLSREKPDALIIIDAVEQKGKLAGEISEIELGQVPENKIADYSIHQFPSTNMLREIAQTSQMLVFFYAVQIKSIPDRIKPGLSREVNAAVPKMCRKVTRQITTILPQEIPC